MGIGHGWSPSAGRGPWGSGKGAGTCHLCPRLIWGGEAPEPLLPWELGLEGDSGRSTQVPPSGTCPLLAGGRCYKRNACSASVHPVVLYSSLCACVSWGQWQQLRDRSLHPALAPSQWLTSESNSREQVQEEETCPLLLLSSAKSSTYIGSGAPPLSSGGGGDGV